MRNHFSLKEKGFRPSKKNLAEAEVSASFSFFRFLPARRPRISVPALCRAAISNLNHALTPDRSAAYAPGFGSLSPSPGRLGAQTS